MLLFYCTTARLFGPRQLTDRTLFSDIESGKDGDKKKKDRPKAKRKKVPDKQMPRLVIFGLEQECEVVECQLETAKHSFITFKFNRDDDQPAEIAENLVFFEN